MVMLNSKQSALVLAALALAACGGDDKPAAAPVGQQCPPGSVLRRPDLPVDAGRGAGEYRDSGRCRFQALRLQALRLPLRALLLPS